MFGTIAGLFCCASTSFLGLASLDDPWEQLGLRPCGVPVDTLPRRCEELLCRPRHGTKSQPHRPYPTSAQRARITLDGYLGAWVRFVYACRQFILLLWPFQMAPCRCRLRSTRDQMRISLCRGRVLGRIPRAIHISRPMTGALRGTTRSSSPLSTHVVAFTVRPCPWHSWAARQPGLSPREWDSGVGNCCVWPHFQSPLWILPELWQPITTVPAAGSHFSLVWLIAAMMTGCALHRSSQRCIASDCRCDVGISIVGPVSI